MAKKKSSGRSNSAFTTKFAPVRLQAEDKKSFEAWLSANEKDFDTFFTNTVVDGWKTSFTWDSENDCFIASCTMRDEDDKNYDVCVTSRAGNAFQAFMMTYYKIYEMFAEKKIPTEKVENNWG